MLLFAEVSEDPKKSFAGMLHTGGNKTGDILQFSGRMLLVVMFLTLVQFDSYVRIFFELIGLGLVTLVAVGFKTKASAMLLTILLLVSNMVRIAAAAPFQPQIHPPAPLHCSSSPLPTSDPSTHATPLQQQPPSNLRSIHPRHSIAAAAPFQPQIHPPAPLHFRSVHANRVQVALQGALRPPKLARPPRLHHPDHRVLLRYFVVVWSSLPLTRVGAQRLLDGVQQLGKV